MGSVLDWLRGGTVAGMPEGDHRSVLSEQLRQEQETNLLLTESLVDLELAAEDASWRRMIDTGEQEFTRDGLTQITAICRLMAIKNPLIKRGLSLRHVYVWGSGLGVGARANGKDGGQDVNAVIQSFWDEPLNRKVLTGAAAAEENSRALGTDGNLFFALFTAPRTGAVRVRDVPWDEISDVLCNPEDRTERWFYRRQWTVLTPQPMGGTRPEIRQALYPDVHHRPQLRPRQWGDIPIYWDAPIVHVRVNGHKGWKFGVGDAYAAVDWARAFKEFLEDWARLMKSLSRFAWKATSKGSKAAQMASKIAAAPTTDPLTGLPLGAGATAVMGLDQDLAAIPKTGATIDSESGRPLATMIAAGLDVPVTMLLGDPGLTGSRAVAETLDEPTRLVMEARRQVWQGELTTILNYVIDQSVKAPQGLLKGKISRDEYDREVVTLAGDTERTVDFDWPDLTKTDPVQLVEAIVKADSTTRVPPIVVARLLLQALGVEQIDEILDDLTDEDGNYIPPDVTAGQAAVDAFRRGEDPAALVGDAQPAAPVPE